MTPIIKEENRKLPVMFFKGQIPTPPHLLKCLLTFLKILALLPVYRWMILTKIDFIFLEIGLVSKILKTVMKGRKKFIRKVCSDQLISKAQTNFIQQLYLKNLKILCICISKCNRNKPSYFPSVIETIFFMRFPINICKLTQQVIAKLRKSKYTFVAAVIFYF